MKIITVASQKGGSGKTILSVHLAVLANQKTETVLLVDLDPQRSAGAWFRARKQNTPTLVETDIVKLSAVLEVAEAEGYTLVIIDTAPHAGKSIEKISAMSDLTLIPCRPAILDLRAIGITVESVKNSPAAIVLNSCPPGRGPFESSITREARAALSKYSIPISPTSIVQRVAFAYSLIGGLSVSEYEPEGKAANEISNLWSWIQKEIA